MVQDKSSVINGETPNSEKGQPSTRRRLTWAYVAGFVDADGSIMITFQNKKMQYYSVMVEVSQKDPFILHELQKKFGGNVYDYMHKNKKYGDIPNSNWRIQNNIAYDFLVKIRKHLILKRKQADLAIKFQEHIRDWYKNNHKKCKPESGEKRLPQWVLNYREKMRSEMARLNSSKWSKPSSVATTESDDLERGCDSLN